MHFFSHWFLLTFFFPDHDVLRPVDVPQGEAAGGQEDRLGDLEDLLRWKVKYFFSFLDCSLVNIFSIPGT